MNLGIKGVFSLKRVGKAWGRKDPRMPKTAKRILGRKGGVALERKEIKEDTGGGDRRSHSSFRSEEGRKKREKKE